MRNNQKHILAATIIAGIMLLAVATDSFAQTNPCSADKLDAQAYQSCLMIQKRQKIFYSPYVMAVRAIKGTKEALGTGVVGIVDGTTYVITNNHVIEGAEEIFLQFSDDNEGIYAASLVGRDPAADLALLSAPVLPRGIGAAVFGPKPRIGEEVYALGYPYGIRSVTGGFVNALQTWLWLYFLTQTPSNPGNSGGPLFNSNHELIGFNTMIIPGATMSFVLSIEYARQILLRLTREKLVEHGEAGFSFTDTSRILPHFFGRHMLSYPPDRGIMVTRVDAETQAAKSGIRVGDMIINIDGVHVKNAEELDKIIFLNHRPGDKVTFTMKRGIQVFERTIKLVQYVFPSANVE